MTPSHLALQNQQKLSPAILKSLKALVHDHLALSDETLQGVSAHPFLQHTPNLGLFHPILEMCK